SNAFDESVAYVFAKGGPDALSDEAKSLAIRWRYETPDSFSAVMEAAEICVARGEWDSAQDLLAKATALRPEEVRATLLLAKVLNKQGNGDEAEKLVNAYLERF